MDAPEVKEVIHVDEHNALVTTLPRFMRSKGNVGHEIIGRWLILRAQDPEITGVEAAKKLGVNVRTLYRYISKATKEGWLKFEDPLERIEHEIIPKTLDNISRFLDEGDRTVTIEAAKGTIFHTYKASQDAPHTFQPVLALKIELAPGAEPNISVGGNVFGKPREVLDALPILEAKIVPVETRTGTGEEVDQEVRQQANRGSEESV